VLRKEATAAGMGIPYNFVADFPSQHPRTTHSAIPPGVHSSILPTTPTSSTPYIERGLRTPLTTVGKYSFQENLPSSQLNATNYDYLYTKPTTTDRTTSSGEDPITGDLISNKVDKLQKAFVALLPNEKVDIEKFCAGSLSQPSSKVPTRPAVSKKAINTEGLPESFLTNRSHDDILNTGFYSTKK
jgi:hypothetical protein